MDERTAIDVEQPEPPLMQAVPPQPGIRLWRRRPVQIGAGLLAAAAAAGIYFAATSGSSQIHVRGTLTLGPLASGDSANPSSPTNGDPCISTGGYTDISAGTTVLVGGGAGQTLAVGALSAGVEQPTSGTGYGQCVFSFDVVVPSGQSAYTVTISHRGTQTVTPQQVAAGIQLGLGQ